MWHSRYQIVLQYRIRPAGVSKAFYVIVSQVQQQLLIQSLVILERDTQLSFLNDKILYTSILLHSVLIKILQHFWNDGLNFRPPLIWKDMFNYYLHSPSYGITLKIQPLILTKLNIHTVRFPKKLFDTICFSEACFLFIWNHTFFVSIILTLI